MKKQFEKFNRQTLTPKLRSHGFRTRADRAGRAFRRDLDTGIVQMLAFSGSRKNSVDEFSFTADISFMRMGPSFAANFAPDEPDSWILGLRMGMITRGVDHWYAMTPQNQEQIQAELLADLDRAVLPLLERARDEATIQTLSVLSNGTMSLNEKRIWIADFIRQGPTRGPSSSF